MTNLTPLELEILKSLRDNTEGECENPEGEIWGSSYLWDACPKGMTTRQFDGVLGALRKKGFYLPDRDNGDFGSVRMN